MKGFKLTCQPKLPIKLKIILYVISDIYSSHVCLHPNAHPYCKYLCTKGVCKFNCSTECWLYVWEKTFRSVLSENMFRRSTGWSGSFTRCPSCEGVRGHEDQWTNMDNNNNKIILPAYQNHKTKDQCSKQSLHCWDWNIKGIPKMLEILSSKHRQYSPVNLLLP